MSAPIDLIALSLLPLPRWRFVAGQLRSGIAARDILEAQCADGASSGRPRPAWTDATRLRERAARALDAQNGRSVQALAWSDPRYPADLLTIVDPPPVLWVAGDPARLSGPAVAIVGSRTGTPYALNVAERLAADLAMHGLAVVSGLARGVDSAAHRGALASDGCTVAVVGCGTDIVYPAEHATLAADIVRHGAIVSELLPGTAPRQEFFPRRNRIISGLSRAVVVIEAGEKSGSLITARCALEQGRDVLAVPGNILSGRNRGGHALLRDGARLVESADDVLEELGFSATRQPPTGPGAASSGPPDDPVLAALIPGEAADLGEIAARSGMQAARILARLFELELRGWVGREPGGRFVRFDRTC